ncbi:hypothetical protein ScPMuIL_012352 [Solemya velum]
MLKKSHKSHQVLVPIMFLGLKTVEEAILLESVHLKGEHLVLVVLVLTLPVITSITNGTSPQRILSEVKATRLGTITLGLVINLIQTLVQNRIHSKPVQQGSSLLVAEILDI